MTLTYNTLLYNDSLPIHDLTSWRLTTQRWLDLTWKHPLHVSDSCWWFDIWHSLRVDDTMSGYAQRVALQWLTAHPWLNVLTSHCSPVTWLDIQTPTAYVLTTHVDDLTSDIHCALMIRWAVTHNVLITLTYDTAQQELDLTFKHSLCVDDSCWWLDVWHLLCIVTWCLLTHYVLMTLTYDTLLYNDSLPIHDLTSRRLTAHRWLDLTFKNPLRVDDSCWWFDIWHSLRVDDLMSSYALHVIDFDMTLLNKNLT